MYASDSDSECEVEWRIYEAAQRRAMDGYEEDLSVVRLAMTCRSLYRETYQFVQTDDVLTPRIISLVMYMSGR